MKNLTRTLSLIITISIFSSTYAMATAPAAPSAPAVDPAMAQMGTAMGFCARHSDADDCETATMPADIATHWHCKKGEQYYIKADDPAAQTVAEANIPAGAKKITGAEYNAQFPNRGTISDWGSTYVRHFRCSAEKN